MDLRDEFEEAGCRRAWALICGLPPEAAVWRIEGQQWTLRDEMLAVAVERVDHWGLAQAYLHSNGKGLPDQSIEIARPWKREDAPGAKAPKKDRYQKSRERAAFFGFAETG